MMTSLGQKTALIGHTGFVGSNLARFHTYSNCFNSRNINEIAGRQFDVVVCAGVVSVKWKANKDPAADWLGIEQLLDPLKTVVTDRFVLISTIDVYPDPVRGSEDVVPNPAENHAYGRHRFAVEQFVAEHFAQHHIVRLPGLFGPGLKKNIIFDLLHDNQLDLIQPESTFQYYSLDHIGDDVAKVIHHRLRLLNLATEPIKTSEILAHFAPDAVVGANAGPAVSYDFRSNYASLWHRRSDYLYDAQTVLHEIGAFMRAERERLAAQKSHS
jgi:nucleoside-diphosphate-sugar epimerase